MGRKEDLEILYDKPVDKYVIQWGDIVAPCRIANLLSYQDIAYLNKIATSVKWAGNPSKKKEMITQLMEARNFKRLDCGTNRIVFKYMENQDFLIKVAFDRVAIQDNLKEYKNQEYLKPFCAKCFEVSPCGTVGMFERVHAVKNEEQFLSIADRVFDIIVNCFLGKYVLADFGTKFYKNWGVRKGAYPVILDYPYLYELDGGKIFCTNKNPASESEYCGGEIDYDAGFNFLVCKKCGKVYLASDLEKKDDGPSSLIVEREEDFMEITIQKRDGSIVTFGDEKETKTYKKERLPRREYKMKKGIENLKITIERGDHSEILNDEIKAEAKKFVRPGGVDTELEKESAVDVNCKKLEVTIEKNGKTYVGKAEVANPNPYNNYTNHTSIYGSGAVLQKEEPKKETPTITRTNDKDLYYSMGDTIDEIVDEVKDETAITEDNTSTIVEAAIDASSNYKYDNRGNAVYVDDDEDVDHLLDEKPSAEEVELFNANTVVDVIQVVNEEETDETATGVDDEEYIDDFM